MLYLGRNLAHGCCRSGLQWEGKHAWWVATSSSSLPEAPPPIPALSNSKDNNSECLLSAYQKPDRRCSGNLPRSSPMMWILPVGPFFPMRLRPELLKLHAWMLVAETRPKPAEVQHGRLQPGESSLSSWHLLLRETVLNNTPSTKFRTLLPPRGPTWWHSSSPFVLLSFWKLPWQSLGVPPKPEAEDRAVSQDPSPAPWGNTDGLLHCEISL